MKLADSTAAKCGTNNVNAIVSITSAGLYNFHVYNTLLLSKIISGAVGLIKNGDGILTLSENNTYSGNTYINNGVLVLTNLSCLPGYNINGRYNVAPGSTLAVYNAITDANIATLLATTNFAANSAIGFDTTSGNRTYGNAIVNTSQGAIGITKLGNGILTLSTGNTYTGATLILAGTLSTPSANIIPDSSAVTIASGAILALGGTEQLSTISGGGTLNCGTNALTLSSSSNAAFAGTLTSSLATGAAITKNGTGTQTFSGTVNVIRSVSHNTGGIAVVGGTFTQNLAVSTRNYQMAIQPSYTASLTVSDGGTMNLVGFMFGENSGGTAIVNVLTGGIISNAGDAWMSGVSETLNVNGGTWTNGSSFDIGGGTLGTNIINITSGTFSVSGNINWNRGNVAGTVNTINLDGGTIVIAAFFQQGTGTNTFNFNGGTFSNSGNLTINHSAITTNVKSGGAIFSCPSGTTLTFTNILVNAGGGGGVVKTGLGRLVLNGVNTFTGQVSVLEGTLSVASVNNNSTNGVFGNSILSIVLGSNGKTGILQYTTAANATTTKGIILPLGAIGTLDITGATNVGLTITGNISGSGSLIKTGQGVMTYSGNNTYTGGTTLSEGINVVASDTAFGTGTINFNGGSIRAHTVSQRTLTNNIIINASTSFLTTAGEKSLILAGTVTITGLRQLAVAAGSNDTTQPLIISGTIGDGGNNYQINKSGAGILVLIGQNTFGGSLVLQAGNTRILYPTIGDIRTTAGTLQFASGITNDISSSIRNNTQAIRIDTNGQNVIFASLSSSNSGGLIKTGAGTLTLTGSNNAFRGSPISNAGTLIIAGTFSCASRIAVSDITGSTTGAITVSGTLIQTASSVGGPRALQIALQGGNSGTFNVVSGGNVTLFSGCMLGENAGGNGTFNVTGGIVTTNGQFWFSGANSTLTVSGGTLNCGSTIYIGGGSGTTISTLTISGGIISTPSNLNFGIGAATSTMTVNLNGGTFSCATFEYNQGTATINLNGGILSFTGAGNTPLASQLIFSVKSGGAIVNIPAVARVVTIQSALTDGAGGGGLTKTGAGLLSLSAINTYTGTTNISAGTLRVVKKISGTGSDASFTQADFTQTTLSVTFVSGNPPSVGNTFRLFPGTTQQTYSTVTLVNYAGTASYDSTNSTLTINT